MSAHAPKPCPRCGVAVTCRVSNIAECQCSTVQLSGTQRQAIAEQYAGCLCATCLVALRDTSPTHTALPGTTSNVPPTDPLP